MKSKDTPNVTSSPGSAGGASPLSRPGGQQIELFGPAQCHASHSAPPVSKKALPTSATCGPNSTGSSVSASLQRSLANRLRANLAGAGSPEYSLTWKHWDMPSREPICALRASARRTSGNGYGGWPTPGVSNHGKGESPEAKQARGRNPGLDLAHAAQIAGWLTPSANDDASGLPGSKMQIMLPAQAKMLGAESMSHARMANRGVLNPDLSRWLMGYPTEHLCCGVMAMQSFRKSGRRS